MPTEASYTERKGVSRTYCTEVLCSIFMTNTPEKHEELNIIGQFVQFYIVDLLTELLAFNADI